MENNKMVSFDYIINECFNSYKVYIPILQRNYKWNIEIAAKLAVDLWNAFRNKQAAYTIGMITFYEEETKLQLIDGQQRIITLFMLLKFIMPDKEYFSFEFERDEGISEEYKKRKTYLSNIQRLISEEEKDMYTDIIRFKRNYGKIVSELESNGYEEKFKGEFMDYIKNRVYFLLHISATEPFDEFMNLNNNKTRFVISDRIKANLIIDSDEKEKVLDLFHNLSNILFSDKNVWELVQQGYLEMNTAACNEKRKKDMLYQDENRLKLLCCERYGSSEFDGSSTLGYEYKKEFDILSQYYEILDLLRNDISNQNWNSYNGFNCLHKLNKKLRFFGMLKEKKENLQGKLEEYLLSEVNSISPFEKACFIESQLENKKLCFDYIDDNRSVSDELNKADEKQGEWMNSGMKEYNTFVQIYSAYINEKYNNKR